MGEVGSRDRGQVFPVYIVAIAGFLFAALAFVVVGMASATRSEAQGAADAAALAAAREARDKALVGMDLLALTPEDWEAIVEGGRLTGTGACAKAVEFAALNGATAQCAPGDREFAVRVLTDDTVGKSVIPASDTTRARAEARAEIVPLCSLRSAPTPSVSPSPSPSPTASTPPGGGTTSPPASVGFRCRGGAVVTLDPANPGSLSKLSRKLFSVRLAD
ncbi:pilus assembly protein TadG-related protein [Streptomyces sp. NPDC058662]|uniref:pilus assembly protein TadG-related protein n=1 Tax=Streptomyces sp. NPDC058662 TaxID=3346583 RepID=UPI00365CDD2F